LDFLSPNAEVTRILQTDNYQGDADFEIYRGRIRQGAATQRSVNLRANTCYAFMAVGGAGVSDLNMGLLQNRRQIATDNARTAFPQVRHCTQTASAYQVAIRSVAGSGEFVFRVFKQQARGGGP